MYVTIVTEILSGIKYTKITKEQSAEFKQYNYKRR